VVHTRKVSPFWRPFKLAYKAPQINTPNLLTGNAAGPLFFKLWQFPLGASPPEALSTRGPLLQTVYPNSAQEERGRIPLGSPQEKKAQTIWGFCTPGKDTPMLLIPPASWSNRLLEIYESYRSTPIEFPRETARARTLKHFSYKNRNPL